ncbi:MAG: MBL fold metallo-hydrolase [bacterium]
MVITFPKNRCIRCNVSDVSVLIDPSEGSKGNLILRTSANVLDADVPFDVIHGAGEYEVEGMVIRGIQLGKGSCDGPLVRTVYSVSMEGLQLGFLEEVRGDLSEKILDKMGEIDVLFISVGENYLDIKKAASLIKQLDPRIVVPLGEKNDDILALAETFGEKPEPIEKLVIKKRDIHAEERLKFIWLTTK